MKKAMLLLLLCLCLTGCSEEIRVDTVVHIPLNPEIEIVDTAPMIQPCPETEAATESPPESSAATQPPTQATTTPASPTTAPTTEATTEPTTEATTEPTTEAATEETTEETTEATTEAPTETEPSETTGETQPTEPTTEPVQPTQPTLPPELQPSTEETTEPTTQPTTSPTEETTSSTDESVTQPSTGPEESTIPTDGPTETTAPSEPVPTEPEYQPGALEAAVLAQINSHRANAGLSALVLDRGISIVAELRAREISVSWSHTRPGGGDWHEALAEYGHVGGIGENLIYVSGTPVAEAMVAKWMTSDANSGNILSDATVVGIGVYEENGFTYLAAIFVE